MVELAAHLASGESVTAELGRIEVVVPEPPIQSSARPRCPGNELIAVCMTTFDPDLVLLQTQLESLRAQTDQQWDPLGERRLLRP